MNIDISMLYLFVGMSFALVAIGFAMRFSVPMSLFVFIAGGLLMALFVLTDNIIVEYGAEGAFEFDITPAQLANQTVSGGTLTETNSQVVVLSSENQYQYSVTSGTVIESMQNVATFDIAIGEEVKTGSTLIGKKIQCIQPELRKVGTPAGNFTVAVFNSLDSNIPFRLFESMSANSLTTSFAFYTFCIPEGTEHVLALRDIVGIAYSDGTALNNIETRRTSSDVFDSTNTAMAEIINPSTVWAGGAGTLDLNIRMYDELPVSVTRTTYTYAGNELTEYQYDGSGSGSGNGTAMSGNPVFSPFTQELKVFMVLMATIMMLVGGVIEIESRRK